MSGARTVRLMLMGIVVVGLVGATAWFVFGPKSSAQLLQAGETAYDAGLQAFREENAALAKLRFAESEILAKKAMERLEIEIKNSKETKPEQVQEWTQISGKANYLRAISLRDESFAKAMEAGKKIAETDDTSTGGKFRSFLSIPESDARKDAIASLRNAAGRLPKDEQIQVEALRVEVMSQPMAWSLIQRFATELLKAKPADPRSLYLMARFDFEQPDIKVNQFTGPPTPPEKRRRNRVIDALASIDKLKAVNGYPLGRTLFLEAQIRQWLLTDYHNKGELPKAQIERDTLETLFFDNKTGALARMKNGDGMKDLSTWDVEGILGVHVMALESAVEQQRKKGDSLARVKSTLNATVAICQDLDKLGLPVFTLDNATGITVMALSKSQSVLASDAGKEWNNTLEAARKSLKTSLEKEIASPSVVAEFSALLQRESIVAVNSGDTIRANALRKEARAWVDEALTNVAKRKTPAPAFELHVMAAEMKFADESKRDAIEPHLIALRDSKNPNYIGFAHLLHGVVLEREGRLDRARLELEKVLTLNHADLKLRANMALTNVYLGLGQPDNALESLQAVEKVYEAYDELTPQEKLWAQNFLRSADDMAVLQIVANLETAKQRISRFTRDQPAKPVPSSLFANFEKAAFESLGKLPKQKKHSLLARQAFINYFAFTGRLDRAEQEIASAIADHPDSAALLQLDIALIVRKARESKGVKAESDVEKELKNNIDKRVLKFINQFPEDRGARLFWVTWLARTGRNDEALDYLKSPTNFPGVKDTTYHRLLASLLVSKGNTKEASKILQQMPQDPLIDAMLIQIAETGPTRSKSVQEAMSRYVSNGLFRIFNAELALQEKRYADAANHFFRTLDFTQVKSLAQGGLQRSLLILAGEKPAEARQLIAEMLKDYPSEPVLLLPYAVACLNLDDVGQLEDNWETTKSMASALHAWEQAVLKTNPDRAATTLAKAELWTRSNYPETARVEVLRALESNSSDPTALTLIIRLDVALARVPEARKYLEVLKKAKPDVASTLLLEAQIESADGKQAKAIEMLEALVEKHPKESGAFALLVNLLARDKQSAKAIKWSQTWVENLPNDLDASQNLVAQLTLWKKGDEAKQKADAFTQLALNDVRKQLEERKYADEKDPELKRKEVLAEARALLELRFAQAFARGEDHAEAERRLRAIIKDRDHAPAYMVLGEILMAKQAWEETAKTYYKVIELEKNNFVAGNNLAWVLVEHLNKPTEALELLRTINKGRFSGKALPGDRLHPEVLDTLGLVYLKLNRPEHFEEMSQIFEAARKRYPRDPRMYLYHGYAYAGLGDKTKASQMFQSAIALASTKDSILPPAQRDKLIRDAEDARKRLGKV